jgi:aspartyl-tRNA(Asn)/glutamyl-tRNA(Gln) amidotransferase subunit C
MTNVKMTREQVLAISRLIKVELTGAEIEKFETTIPQTLDVIDVLKELDTNNVLPTSQVTGLTNVFRDESVKTTLSKDSALSNAKEKIRGLFATKAVFNRT